MPQTILEYANDRGVTKQTVYSAIKKNGIETYQGIANGKSAQYLSDEAIFALDQVIRPSQKSVAILEANMAVMEAQKKDAIAQGVIEAKDETIRAKDELRDELVITRGQMLEQIQSIGSQISIDIDKRVESTVIKNLEDKVYELEKEIVSRACCYQTAQDEYERIISEANAELSKLRNKVLEDKEHPWKHLWRCLTRKE